MGNVEQKKRKRTPRTTQRGRTRKFAIQPGLSKRLIKLCEDSNIPKSARIAYVCEETSRKKQTVNRWFQTENPGCPDLESFALLCFRFQVDANWFLGLTPTQFPLPRPTDDDSVKEDKTGQEAGILEYLSQIQSELERVAPGHVPLLMPGDEMEPRIRKGARLVVDPAIQDMTSNGIYVLEYKGQRMVCIVEHRIGTGLVLSCENVRYQPTIFKDLGAAKKAGVKLIGEIKGWHQSTWV